ncbi:MAG: hypothetical protein E6H78_16300, partial [Betaproteobacteria bacterium]
MSARAAVSARRGRAAECRAVGDRPSGTARSRHACSGDRPRPLAPRRCPRRCGPPARDEGEALSDSAAALASRLVDAGLSSAELEAKTSLFARALAALPADARDLFAWWVPGRIEFLGKHTDYAGGR